MTAKTSFKPFTLTALAAVFSALSLSACAQAPDKSAAASVPTEPPRIKVGMPNPASVYCAKLGGQSRLEKSQQGEYSICVLPDGTEIEEWALFRRDHPAK